MTKRWIWLATSFGLGMAVTNGYFVGPPLSLENLAAEADYIFKGTVLSTTPVEDPWFKSVNGFQASETVFKVVSGIKGEKSPEVRFRHYDHGKVEGGMVYQPQFYHFELGQSYIVFARRSETVAGAFRQLWANHNAHSDQGVLWCLNDKPTAGASVKEIFWNEMTTMLSAANPTNVTYAIGQLDGMSQSASRKPEDFDRRKVLSSVHSLMAHSNAEVARTSITMIGSRNPYLSDERAPYWLSAVGAAALPGLAKMNAGMTNVGGELYWRDLVAIANQNGSTETRALAIRALGLTRHPSVQEELSRWLSDKEPAIRVSATLLLADFPDANQAKRFAELANETRPKVRTAVAYGIGFAQKLDSADVLNRLLHDADRDVRRAAAMSLLSFSAQEPRIRELWQAHLDHQEFHPLFLNALAAREPGKFRDALAKVIEEGSSPTNWWGGEIPAFTSWKILFKYLRSQPADAVQSGSFDRELDGLEKVGNYSSSEPRDIYAFYVLRGMASRAKAFREAAKKRFTYDIDYFFKEVDQHPSNYNGPE